ncbi:MAG: hypothetical protein PHE51_00685 [Eubacteriales bacterium]|nr:hypothetical protein [Eubacteriales bacterium]
MNLLGLLIAFVFGGLISFVNYKISKFTLINKEKNLFMFSMLRQVLNVGYLVLCYFVAPYTPFDGVYILIGGATGITLPMIYFTPKLLKASEDKTERKEEL